MIRGRPVVEGSERIAVYVLLLVLIAGLCSVYATSNYTKPADDSFITFRYAQNLELGVGLVFNEGERYFGSTAMGLAVFYAAVSFLLDQFAHLFGLSWVPTHQIPEIAVWTSALSLAVIVWITFRIGQRYVHPLIAAVITALFGVYFFSAEYTNYVPGHETYPFVASACLSVYLLFYRQQPKRAGLLLAVGTTFRPDMLLLAALCATALGIDALLNRALEGAGAPRRFRGFCGAYLPLALAWFVSAPSISVSLFREH